MTPEDRWAMFAAQALSGLLANPNGSSQNEARLAAAFADDLAAEFAARSPAVLAGTQPPAPPPSLPRPLGSYGVQDSRRAATGRAIAALSARTTAPPETPAEARASEPRPAEASPAPSGPPSPPR